ncbi:TetR/AcrR family transcriptional regulator [Micromonospora sp. NPDC050417]|uniref:TetR/AcrR family transcriptional regulator n=1 Tax=Micromonospora sp. NPDC050417 TaxID=3364280 RepID=UPI0037BD15A4
MPASGSRRGPTKGDQRERALLDAAQIVLRQKPLAQVTIDELAAAAGIARSGFYFYFESKQALLAALCESTLGKSEEELAEWVEADDIDRDALRRGLTRALARWRVDGRWLCEAFVNPFPGPEILQVRERVTANGCTAVNRRIERDIRAGVTVVGDPTLLSLMVVKLRLVMFAHAFTNPEEQTDDALLDSLADATLRLLYGTLPAGAESAAPTPSTASA